MVNILGECLRILINCSQLSKTCNYNMLFGSSARDRHAQHISGDIQRITLNASRMTILGGRTEQLVIIAVFLPHHWLYEWFSQFHSCGTYSVLSRSHSVILGIFFMMLTLILVILCGTYLFAAFCVAIICAGQWRCMTCMTKWWSLRSVSQLCWKNWSLYLKNYFLSVPVGKYLLERFFCRRLVMSHWNYLHKDQVMNMCFWY